MKGWLDDFLRCSHKPGVPFTREHIEALTAARRSRTGHAISLATRAKIAAALKGHPFTEERKAALRAAWKRRKESGGPLFDKDRRDRLAYLTEHGRATMFIEEERKRWEEWQREKEARKKAREDAGNASPPATSPGAEVLRKP